MRLVNVVKASDLPVDERLRFDIELDEFGAGSAARLQVAVEGRWDDAVAYVAPRLLHAMRRLPSPLTVILSDATRNRETTQVFFVPDAQLRDIRRALETLPAIANAAARGTYGWDLALLEWRPQADGDAGAGVRSPVIPPPSDLQGGAEAVVEDF